MKRILLTIAYDGTNYCGWQKQKMPMVPTVEAEVEKACQRLFQDTSLECIGASRTDTGVHALGQRAVVDVDTTIPTEKIPLAIRGYLPKDIVVTKAEEVTMEFHPRYDCVKKTYQYRILNTEYQNPLLRNYTEWIAKKLDILSMNHAAKHLIGTHDFKAFCAAGGSTKTTVRTIFECSVTENGEEVLILVTGDGFLYNMVRIIAGTLIEVGKGKLSPEDIPSILASRDRTKAGKTAGAQGLTLMRIYYDSSRNSLT